MALGRSSRPQPWDELHYYTSSCPRHPASWPGLPAFGSSTKGHRGTACPSLCDPSRCIFFYYHRYTLLTQFFREPWLPFPFLSFLRQASGMCWNLTVWPSSSCSFFCEHFFFSNKLSCIPSWLNICFLGDWNHHTFSAPLRSTPSLPVLSQVSFMPLVLINDSLYLGYLCVVHIFH